MTPAEVLEKAADVIDERGHCKGKLIDSSGRVCITGAICFAINGYAGGRPVGGITQYLHAVIGRDVISWNDAPERTAAEVTSTMRAVAAVLRAQEAQEPVRETETAL
jgi:hypothetical protein